MPRKKKEELEAEEGNAAETSPEEFGEEIAVEAAGESVKTDDESATE